MASNKDPSRDYDAAKAALKAFLAQFHTVNPDTGRKDFVYARQITNIAHREQVEIKSYAALQIFHEILCCVLICSAPAVDIWGRRLVEQPAVS